MSKPEELFSDYNEDSGWHPPQGRSVGAGQIEANPSYLGTERGRLQRAYNAEMEARFGGLRHAGDVADLRRGEMSGQATRSFVGASRAGDALAARRAMMAGGAGLTGVASETGRMGMEERLRTTGNVMNSSSKMAGYEQAMYEDYARRLQIHDDMQARTRAAQTAYQKAQDDADEAILGAAFGAVAAGGAAAMGAGQAYGGGGQQQPPYNTAQSATNGYGYGRGMGSGGYGGQSSNLGSGSDYYNSAYESYYGK